MTFEAYQDFRSKGYLLAGKPSDLRQRACVYHQLYLDSGKRNIFPLVAAHGALWGAGYFKRGMLGGKILSLPYLVLPKLRKAKLDALDQFAEKFRDINRRVCAEAYAIFHYTRVYGSNAVIREVIGDAFGDIMEECNASIAADSYFPQQKREALFVAFFNWEQDNIVAPRVIEAFDHFHWRAITYFALRPKIEFTYFGKDHTLQFKNFRAKEDRIAHGLQAYRRAEAVGLEHVENAISLYQIMPQEFHRDPRAYYRNIEMALV